ncbi:interferon lambda receptor 1 isoform 1-T1 [Liasis olivaceus]
MSFLEVGIVLLMVIAPSQPVQGEELQPPRNITFVSKDYSMFVKWLPPDGSPLGVSYTVLWMESFDVQWKEVQPCRNITGTLCNITCVLQEPSNRYWVKVEAQSGTRAGFISSATETVDYILRVELAPPVLRVKYTRNIFGVNISFTYPFCMKHIFQDLAYDLEIWKVGSKTRMKYENMHEPSVDINTTKWPHGKYCLHARTSFFRNGDRKRSNFLAPFCLWLHEEARKWELVALPLLAILMTGVVMFLLHYKSKQVEMPSALDFSRYQHPVKVLEFDESKWTMKNVQFILEQKSTPPHQAYSPSTLSVHSSSNEDEDSDDDSSSPVPYAKRLRFQKKDQSCPTVDTIPKSPDSSSGSGNSQLNGESWPAVMMSEPFFTAEWMTRDASSEILERTFLSKDSIMDEPVSFADDFPDASRECQEVANREIDFLNQLIFSEGHSLNFATGLEIRTGGVRCSGICASLENSQSSLCSEPKEQVIENRRCENDSSNCGSLWVEIPHLSVSCTDSVENEELVENNTLKSTCHNYQPKQIHYMSRT